MFPDYRAWAYGRPKYWKDFAKQPSISHTLYISKKRSKDPIVRLVLRFFRLKRFSEVTFSDSGTYTNHVVREGG